MACSDLLWSSLHEPEGDLERCFGILRVMPLICSSTECSTGGINHGLADSWRCWCWRRVLGQGSATVPGPSHPLPFSLQVFHQVLDVSDLHRLRERNVVWLEVQKLQVRSSACSSWGITRALVVEPGRGSGTGRAASTPPPCRKP